VVTMLIATIGYLLFIAIPNVHERVRVAVEIFDIDMNKVCELPTI